MSLGSVLMSVQSLMHATPYTNEPGFSEERNPGDIRRYNDRIRHETLRVGVIGALERPTCSEGLHQACVESFLEYGADQFIRSAESLSHLDGRPFEDPFNEMVGTFRFKELCEKLRKLDGEMKELAASWASDSEES